MRSRLINSILAALFIANANGALAAETDYKILVGPNAKKNVFNKKLRKGEGVTLNLRYVLSLYDILKDNNTGINQYHSVFTFLVGIPIGRAKAKEKREAEEQSVGD